jgi:hypothetical protein
MSRPEVRARDMVPGRRYGTELLGEVTKTTGGLFFWKREDGAVQQVYPAEDAVFYDDIAQGSPREDDSGV